MVAASYLGCLLYCSQACCDTEDSEKADHACTEYLFLCLLICLHQLAVDIQDPGLPIMHHDEKFDG